MYKRTFLTVISIFSVLIAGIIIVINSGSVTLPSNKADKGSIAVYTENGDIIYLDKMEGINKSPGGSYYVTTRDTTIKNVIGVIKDIPTESITDIYGKVISSIDKDRDVLIIYIDGLGYELYKHAADSGRIPFIASLGVGAKALSVYPSITDVNFASMVTGKTPRYTGIHNREKKPLPVPTIFDAAAEKGRGSMLIEANMKILIDEVQTILNIDENKNGDIDDEICSRAMKEIIDPPGVFMIHFHSYDDFGHKYGPSSEEALEQLGVLDSYVENILKEYAGHVIITADHGMHETEDGGAHGTFSSSDMFIPIIERN